MKAARYHGKGDLRLEDVAAPDRDLRRSDVLIRNRVAGICGTDLHEYERGPTFVATRPHPLSGASLPQILGHEYAGVVEAIGPEATGVRIGERVSVMPQIFCGRCARCRDGDPRLCADLALVGLSWPWGGFAEYSVVPSAQVSALPEQVSDELGALVEPTAVAVHAVDGSTAGPGDVVLVTGGGPIGVLVALALRAAGATPLLSEPNPHRRRRAHELDIAVHDPGEATPADRVRELEPGGARAAIECAGSGAALAACIEAVRPAGCIVLTGLHPSPAAIEINDLVLRDLTLVGRGGYPVDCWPRVIELIASGRIPAAQVVTSVIGMDAIVEDGFHHLLDPDDGGLKVLVRIR
jgi:(R,R)-butanediol dehydrogenase / meso-butanediol dehydrogenase / diacetyl reductase